MRPPAPPVVIWHDLECHGYVADLPLWRELAAAQRGAVLDVGAGTGRVALDLARAGHEVVALDVDPVLLEALRTRPGGDRVHTVVADAQGFDLGRTFALIVVPMQTIQLLDDRAAFLAAAMRHLAQGGLLAAALSEPIEPFDPTSSGLPLPDVGERDGWRFASQPVAVSVAETTMRIDRVRTTWTPDGRRTTEPDRIVLAALDAAGLEAEARTHGLSPEPARRIAPTDEHVGSTVVMLRA